MGFGASQAAALAELRAKAGERIAAAGEAMARRPVLPASMSPSGTSASQVWGRWLEEVLAGPVEAEYARRRRAVGRRHAELGLGQQAACVAMEAMQQALVDLAEQVYGRAPKRRRAAQSAVRKICALDLAMVLESYQRCCAAMVRAGQNRRRQELEAQLAAQQSFANTLLDNAAVGVMAVNERGELTSYNRKMQELLGYSAHEVLQRRQWLDAAFPEPQDRQEADLYFAAAASENPPEDKTLLTIRRKDGSQRLIEFWSTPIVRDQRHQGAVTIAFDVTDRRRLEQQLIGAERLAAIGQLAASLAHEIKNPLAGISGAIQVMRSQMAAGDPRRDVLEEVLHQIGRLDSTMRDLLVYARPNPLELRRSRIEPIVDRVLTVVAAEPGFRRMQIIKNYSPDLPEVELDPDQIEQVCMNIVLNAAQAMESGGRVTIEARAGDGQVVLSFTDDGPGMSDYQVKRAFEPFFTTKSRGTGLGLPICRRIVEAHGGSISLSSRLGRGTCATVCLPIRYVGLARTVRRDESG